MQEGDALIDDGTGLSSEYAFSPRPIEELGAPAESPPMKGRGSQPGFQSGVPDMAGEVRELVATLSESFWARLD